MADHLVGLCHLPGVCPVQRVAFRACGGGPTLGTRRCRGLRDPFGRWWHRRVARVAAEALFQVGQLRLEHRYLSPKRFVLGRQLLIGRSAG